MHRPPLGRRSPRGRRPRARADGGTRAAPRRWRPAPRARPLESRELETELLRGRRAITAQPAGALGGRQREHARAVVGQRRRCAAVRALDARLRPRAGASGTRPRARPRRPRAPRAPVGCRRSPAGAARRVRAAAVGRVPRDDRGGGLGIDARRARAAAGPPPRSPAPRPARAAKHHGDRVDQQAARGEEDARRATSSSSHWASSTTTSSGARSE